MFLFFWGFIILYIIIFVFFQKKLILDLHRYPQSFFVLQLFYESVQVLLSQKPFGLESYSDRLRPYIPKWAGMKSQKPFGLESYSDNLAKARAKRSTDRHKSLSAWSPIRTGWVCLRPLRYAEPKSQKPFGLESYSDIQEALEKGLKAEHSHKSLSAWSPIRTSAP